MFFAFIALALKTRNLGLKESDFAVFLSEWVGCIIVVDKLKSLALVGDCLFPIVIHFKAFLPVTSDLTPQWSTQTDKSNGTNDIGNNHHFSLNIIKVDSLHLFVLLSGCCLGLCIAFLGLVLSSVICLLGLLLGLILVLIVILLGLLEVRIVLNLAIELI